MDDTPQSLETTDASHPDEDGTVLVYGFIIIKDLATGEILISTRA